MATAMIVLMSAAVLVVVGIMLDLFVAAITLPQGYGHGDGDYGKTEAEAILDEAVLELQREDD